MKLVRLIYASQTTDSFKVGDLSSILSSARKHNQRNEVTGILVFTSNMFLQCLEGDAPQVNETYHRILKDPRHQEPMLIEYKEVVSRNFLNWSMGLINTNDITDQVNLKYSGSAAFTPLTMSGESAFLFLNELKDKIVTQC